MQLRVVFAGTPAFALPPLAALHAQHRLVGVLSQPDRPAGRGRVLTASPVKQAAQQLGVPVLQPQRLRGEGNELAATLGWLHDLQPDVIVVVAYGLILPSAVLQLPRLGCLNIHASLLPRWRGAAPIQRAIMAGDAETGMMVMKMDVGLDTGPVAATARVAIAPDMTGGELHDALMQEGARLMVAAIEALEQGSLPLVPQSPDGILYAAKIAKAETRIDWSRPATEVHNHIRALSPAPGAWCEMTVGGKPERLKILRSTIGHGSGTPGTVLDDRLTIACGSGAVRLVELQRAGGKPLDADEFLRGAKLGAGESLA